MLHKSLTRFAREFKRYMVNGQYEVTDNGGILLPKAGITLAGLLEHNVNGLDTRYDRNIVPTEGLNHILDVTLHGTAGVSPWYLALFSGAVTPGSTLTAATVAAALTEITSGTDGYSESTRVEFNEAAAAAGVTTNAANKAAFTIVMSSGNLTVNGCFMASASAKGATTGTMYSASRFASARSLANGDIFNLGYTINAAAV
jgi:hypothetical protein